MKKILQRKFSYRKNNTEDTVSNVCIISIILYLLDTVDENLQGQTNISLISVEHGLDSPLKINQKFIFKINGKTVKGNCFTKKIEAYEVIFNYFSYPDLGLQKLCMLLTCSLSQKTQCGLTLQSLCKSKLHLQSYSFPFRHMPAIKIKKTKL